MSSRASAGFLAGLLVAVLPATASARWYDANTGTWLSPDPVFGHLEDPTSRNPYLYANGNPARYADPTGASVYYTAKDGACQAGDQQACKEATREHVMMGVLPPVMPGGVLSAIGSGLASIASQIGTAFRWALGLTAAVSVVTMKHDEPGGVVVPDLGSSIALSTLGDAEMCFAPSSDIPGYRQAGACQSTAFNAVAFGAPIVYNGYSAYQGYTAARLAEGLAGRTEFSALDWLLLDETGGAPGALPSKIEEALAASKATPRQTAWSGDINAINQSVERLGQRALQYSGGDWVRSEQLFQRYLETVKGRLARAGSSYGVEWQPAALPGGTRVPAYIYLHRGSWSGSSLIADLSGAPRLFAYPGSRRLDAAIVDLSKPPVVPPQNLTGADIGYNPVVTGFDITLDASKPDPTAYYQAAFPGAKIIDIRKP